MKKIIYPIIVILIVVGIVLFNRFNEKDNNLKKVRVADTTLTSRSYKLIILKNLKLNNNTRFVI